MSALDSRVRAAYAECRRRARRHYENFPVASYLVPRDKRDALAVIYAFARFADDLADEPACAGRPDVEGRLEALADWREKLRGCYARPPRFDFAVRQAHGPERSRRAHRAEHGVFIALRDAVERFHLSQEHFENLLRAFEQDVRVNRRPDFASLLAYCTCSANPVGRLVLELFGHREPELLALSDEICTALQLTNFWQDVAVDLARDRIYLPLEDLRCFSYTLDDLRAGRVDERWRALLALEIARTRERFARGRPLPEKVVPELRRQLRLTWLGGMTILARIESAGYDVFRRRPALGWRDFLRLYFRSRYPARMLRSDPAPAIASQP